MPWMVPETRLDPEQREFLSRVGKDRKNFWVRGFAGSGKSVLLVHTLIREMRQSPGMSACVVVYTHSLIDMVRSGIPQEYTQVPVLTYHQFRSSPQSFDLILVDEVQDVPEDVLALLKLNARRLVVAGDEAQSIYADGISPDRIGEVTGSETYSLSVLHRLTQKVITIAERLFPEKNLQAAKRSRLKNIEIVVAHASSEEEETRWIWDKALAASALGAPAAILLPAHRQIVALANQILRINRRPPWQAKKLEGRRRKQFDYADLNEHLATNGIPVQYLGNDFGSLTDGDAQRVVYLMTYHSAKGLDFESVLLPRLSDGTEIWRDDPDKARTLFFVALTRSRANLFMSYAGAPHQIVQSLPNELVKRIEVNSQTRGAVQALGGDDIPF